MAPLHGQCYCGNIEYEFTPKDEDLGGVFCHCRTCQVINTHRSFNIASQCFRLKVTKGTPTIYDDNKADSGKVIRRHFCGTCGTALFSVPESMPGVIFVKVGALDNAPDIKLAAEICWLVDSQLPNLALNKDNHKDIKHFNGMDQEI
ncbi:hypothetical protein MNV49_006196 [Pseudohyphozyma bogoriensis]|nr:hypothetical protein MNV49_006196 [Pseudohyphozyma bogoriensis]